MIDKKEKKILKKHKKPDNICYILPTAVLLESKYLIRSFNEFHLRAQVTFTDICSIYTRFLSQ